MDGLKHAVLMNSVGCYIQEIERKTLKEGEKMKRLIKCRISDKFRPPVVGDFDGDYMFVFIGTIQECEEYISVHNSVK
jgi:hypothetical protein